MAPATALILDSTKANVPQALTYVRYRSKTGHRLDDGPAR